MDRRTQTASRASSRSATLAAEQVRRMTSPKENELGSASSQVHFTVLVSKTWLTQDLIYSAEKAMQARGLIVETSGALRQEADCWLTQKTALIPVS